MAGQRIGYVRVSTVEQNTVRQLDGIALDRVFTDHISGATRNRPALEDLRRYVRDGDTVVVHPMVPAGPQPRRLAGPGPRDSPTPGSPWSSSAST